MASIANRLLFPDEKTLSGIFPHVIDFKPTICDVLANTFETCTFRIQLDSAPLPDYPKDLIIRFERSGRSLAALATFQRLVSSQLKDLVPSVLQVGTTMTATAKAEQVDYFVTPYFTETILLEEVWDALDQVNQLQLVDSVVLAVEQLQKLDLKKFGHSPEGIPYISIDDTPPQPVEIAIGGLAHDFFPNVRQFLRGLLHPERKKPRDWNLLETDSGITIQFAYGDIGQVHLSHSDLDELQRNVVFCHNDLEPRNIPMRKLSSGKHELAGVIDWERAGLFPFAYEFGYKDTVLGSSNLNFSWYTLSKTSRPICCPKGSATQNPSRHSGL
ncbi:uncharacterized protein N7529_001588 [Penicillium soppii]|jgi:hypothetical protein|uniref:uncharacterized protein n=1 Tax=Penicillium soppii TaxID=69789 RepID=UPI0025492794|nr:uncharacterized protein N7529_001588 [Penicillium soppii]KAJ5876004.1 hypothetical protein N7529_001588 [Penicillium soppii]